MLKKINYYFVILLTISIFIYSCSHANYLAKEDIYKADILDLIFIEDGDKIGPYIKITVQDKNYIALFDTGLWDTALMISDNILNDLNLDLLGKTKYATNTIPDGKDIDTYFLSEIILSDKHVVYDNYCRSQLFPNHEIIVGLPIFKDFNFLISYNTKKIYLFDKNYVPNKIKKNWINTQLTDNLHGLQFWAKTEGLEDNYLFYLDTGTILYKNGKYYDVVNNNILSNKMVAENRSLVYIIGNYFLKKIKFHTYNLYLIVHLMFF
jgi:hypothetical protein